MSTIVMNGAEAPAGQGSDQPCAVSLAVMNRRRAARAHEIAAHLHARLGRWEQAAEATERAETERLAYQRAVRSAGG